MATRSSRQTTDDRDQMTDGIGIGKLQMAYDLFSLLSGDADLRKFDLLALWPLLLENPAAPDRNAWAFGHALVEYWTQKLTIKQLQERFNFYLQEAESWQDGQLAAKQADS